MRTLLCVLTLCCLAFVLPAAAAVHHVPADFPTIQAALDASTSGDVVLVAPGTYFENLVMDASHDGVELVSESGADVTTIDGGQVGGVFRCSNLGSDTRIAGFTIQNGRAAPQTTDNLGGAFRLEFADVVIENNVIQNNFGEAAGGLYINFSSPTLRGNVLRDNEALASGGAIYCDHDSHALIEFNLIIDNTCGHFGGGLTIWAGSDPQVVNNTIGRNDADLGGGGVFVNMGAQPTLERNIVFDCEIGGGIVRGASGQTPILGCNDVWGNTPANYSGMPDQTGLNGNISADPLFCAADLDDFTLDSGSPCAPSQDCPLMGAFAIGCGPVAVEATSWGRIKGQFR